uniref:Serpin domain-containing protein n=1 Tax=Leersia perrieri TaxID=77586 RepID=A0A0D9XQF6_9ORYZ
MKLSYLRRALLRPRRRAGPPVPTDASLRRLSSSPAPKPDAEAPPQPPPMPTRPWEESLAAAQRAFCLPLAGRDRSTSGGPRLAFAGGVWADASRNLSPEFVGVAGNVYGSAAKKADFKDKPEVASEQINSCVKDSTKGTVAALLPAGTIDQNTGLVLGSALYFRGRWLDRSDLRRTIEQKFFCLDGTYVEVPFVEYDRTRLFAVHDDFKVIKLPYKQGNNERKFSMYIFLPRDPDGLFELTQKVFSEPMFLEQHLPREKCHVGISVPKFTISFQIDVKDFLKDMGLELPFLRDAEFSDMIKEDDSSDPLFLSDVLHKAVLEVDEKGIDETSVSMGLGKPLPAQRFNADHPFFFMIREEVSGTIIFMGHRGDVDMRSVANKGRLFDLSLPGTTEGSD